MLRKPMVGMNKILQNIFLITVQIEAIKYSLLSIIGRLLLLASFIFMLNCNSMDIFNTLILFQGNFVINLICYYSLQILFRGGNGVVIG